MENHVHRPYGVFSWKEREFICRLCGSKDFHRYQVTGMNGKRRDTELWQCSRCSVVFADWRDFTGAP
jgi:hypothetical protein